jgi:uncharacterized membrane protein (DUF485 family)
MFGDDYFKFFVLIEFKDIWLDIAKRINTQTVLIGFYLLIISLKIIFTYRREGK